jgi:hypothetical protein
MSLYYNSTTNGAEQEVEVWENFGTPYLITGIRYCHNESAGVAGPFTMAIQFISQTLITLGNQITNIPASTSPTWNSYYITGSYLVSKLPTIRLSSPNGSNNSIAIGLNFNSNGHTRYETNMDSVWHEFTTGEALIDVIREQITTLTPGAAAVQGNINGSATTPDHVDAYFVTLTSHHNYQFTLARNSGLMNVNMRLVANATENAVGAPQYNNTFGTSYPKTMEYNSSVSTTYVLLVEGASGMDSAIYSVQVRDITPGFTVPTAPVLAVTSPSPTNNAGIILVWNTVPFADNFTIYRSANTITSLVGLTPIVTVTNTPHTDTVPSAGTYHYVVIATNEYGDSGISNDVSVVYQPDSGVPGFDLTIIAIVSMLGVVFLARRCTRRFK